MPDQTIYLTPYGQVVADMENLKTQLVEAKWRADRWKARASELSTRGATVGQETGRIIHDLHEQLAAADARAEHWQAEHDIQVAANQVDLEHALAESARVEALAKMVESMRTALTRVLAVPDGPGMMPFAHQIARAALAASDRGAET